MYSNEQILLVNTVNEQSIYESNSIFININIDCKNNWMLLLNKNDFIEESKRVLTNPHIQSI